MFFSFSSSFAFPIAYLLDALTGCVRVVPYGRFFLQIHQQIMFSRLGVSSLSSSSAAPSKTFGQFSINIYLVAILLASSVQSIDAICAEQHWWQEELDSCIPCTVCDRSESIVLRPCQLHSDTVCGTFDDLELELNWLKSAVEQQKVSKNHFR